MTNFEYLTYIQEKGEVLEFQDITSLQYGCAYINEDDKQIIMLLRHQNGIDDKIISIDELNKNYRVTDIYEPLMARKGNGNNYV